MTTAPATAKKKKIPAGHRLTGSDATYTVATTCLNLRTIRRLRKEKGLTMQQAAAATGLISKQAWYHVESGRAGVSLSRLTRIAALFGCTLDELVTR